MTAEDQLTIQGLAGLIREFLASNTALINDSLEQHRSIVTELREQVNQLTELVFDAESRQSDLRAAVAALQAQAAALTERAGAADDRCAACVLRPRADAVAPGE